MPLCAEYTRINGHRVTHRREDKPGEDGFFCFDCHEGAYTRERINQEAYIWGWFSATPCPTEDGGRRNRTEDREIALR